MTETLRAARALIAGVALLALPRVALAQQAAGSGAVEGFEHVLPQDTVLFLGSRDVDAAARNLRATAYGAWWRDEASAPLREALADALRALGDEATAEIGVDPLALPAMAHGRLALAVAGDLEEAVRAKQPQGIALVLLADVGSDHEACAAILSTLEDKLAADGETARKSEDIDGTEVTILEDAPAAGEPRGRLRVAFHGDTLIVLAEFLPMERDVLAFILERLSGEPAPSLAEVPRFRDSLAAQPGDVQGWLDGAELAAAVRVTIEAKAAPESDEPAAGDEQDSAGQQVLDTWQSLGLPDLGAFSLSMSWSRQGSRVQVRLDWPGKGLVPSILRCLLGPGDAGLLSAAPVTSTAAFCAHVDFGGLLDELIQFAVQSGTRTPADAVDMLAKLHEQLGFDLREDLLEAFDGRLGLFLFRVPPEDALVFAAPGHAVNAVIEVGLHDGAEFNSLIEGFVRHTGAQAARQRSEVLGFEVFHLPLKPGLAMHYAILPDLAIVSCSETLLLDALRRRTDPAARTFAGDVLFRVRTDQLVMPAGLMHYGTASLGLLSAAYVGAVARAQLVEKLSDPKFGDVAHGLAQRLARFPAIDSGSLSACFDGGMLTTLTMDERGLLFQSASP